MQIDSPALQIPTEPGTPFEGGFYVGRLRVGNTIVALIVAPKAGGETTGAWLPAIADVPGARSYFDGALNTAAMAEAGSAIATWALGLDLGGFHDWHLPSRDELELLYRNLKPTTDSNWCYHGDNPSSVPVGYPYELQTPAQTSAAPFKAGEPEAFEPAWYWSGTRFSRSGAWLQVFVGGGQDGSLKSVEGRARAVRRLVIQ